MIRFFDVEYNGSNFRLPTLKEIKICGIWFCNNKDNEYKLNITDKFEKMESKIRLWESRNLKMEGKSLIHKTFGISQLIYVLQVYEIKKTCIVNVERIIFGFMWIGCRSDKERGIDRKKYWY